MEHTKEYNRKVYMEWKAKNTLYNTFLAIKHRCTNPKHPAWHNYGGRGIKLCEEWVDNYRGFVNYISTTLGPRPDKYTLDRIDNNGNYEPGNLKWSTRKEQMSNMRPQELWTNPPYYTYNGEQYIVRDLAKRLGLAYSTVTHMSNNRVLLEKNVPLKIQYRGSWRNLAWLRKHNVSNQVINQLVSFGKSNRPLKEREAIKIKRRSVILAIKKTKAAERLMNQARNLMRPQVLVSIKAFSCKKL